MGRKDVLHNAGEIEKYLEVLIPKLEPSGGVPDAPMSRKERGSSRPPVSEYVMDLWQANPHAGRINAVLREAARSTEDVEILGRPMWKVLGDVLFDHTAIRRWKAAEDPTEARRFGMLCHLLAQRLAIKHDLPGEPYRIRVHVRPEDEPQRPATRAAQKADSRYTDRLIIDLLERVEDDGYEGKEAMEVLQDRRVREGKEAWSIPRMRRARRNVNRERRGSPTIK